MSNEPRCPFTGKTAAQHAEEDTQYSMADYVPDARKHLYISLVKSALRIFAGGAIMGGFLFAGGLLLCLAELLGIAEELV